MLAFEAATKAICERAGQDPADGIMMLLTAAVHMTRTYSRPGTQIELTLAEILGSAIVASDEFFKLREAS